MALAFKRSVRQIKQINYWGILAGIFLLFCIGAGAYYGRMLLEKSGVEREIGEQQSALDALALELRKEKNDEEYKKYQAAKTVMATAGDMDWNENIEYLIDLLDELTALNNSDAAVRLENFQISDTAISLQGGIESIRTVYKEGGVIDKFESFDFVTDIDIPYYNKNDETQEIEFVLDATIQSYEG